MRLHAVMVVLAVGLGIVAIATPAHAAFSTTQAGMFSSSGALPVIRSEAKVEVRGAFADVVVTQTFHNDLDRGVEAVYVFPLAGDAAVRSMTIKTGDQTITASIARRAEARKAYEAAVSAGTVAALTEEERANIFTQAVTGIAADAEVTIELRYDLGLGRTASGWELVLPLVVAPRHVPGSATGKPTTGTGGTPDTDEVGDASRVTPPVRGDKGGGNPVTVTIDLGDVTKSSVEVTSHDAAVTERRGHTKVTVRDARSDRDLVVRWNGAKKGSVDAMAERDGAGGGVVALVVEAPRPAASAKKRRRWLLALDTSGSMDGDALRLLQDAARALVHGIGKKDKIAVLGTGGKLAWKTRARAQVAIEKTIDVLDASGAADLGELLGRALTTAAAAGKGDEIAIVLITDALAADDAAIAARVDGAQRVHVIGVGAAPNRWLLDELARRGRGAEIVLGVGDDVDAAVNGLIAAAASPTATPTVDWGGLVVRDITPATMPELAAGRAVVIAAQVDRLADAKIAVTAGDAKLKARLVAADAGDDGLVGRRWARARIEELVASGGDSETIAQLGLDHGLVTPFTALVARGEKVTVKGGTRTTVAIPVAMPAGMRWQAVFGPAGDSGGVAPAPDLAEGSDIATTVTGEASGGAGAGDDRREEKRNVPKEESPQPTVPPLRDVATSDEDDSEAQASPGASYDAETISVSGRVIMQRRWSGEISLDTGVHVRGDERGALFGLHGGAYRSIARHWKVGLVAKIQDAPAVDRGVEAAAYLSVRRVLELGYQPMLAIDAGIGASLDERGIAWRLGFRLGPWAFAPVVNVDQSLWRDNRRTTVGLGLAWTF